MVVWNKDWALTLLLLLLAAAASILAEGYSYPENLHSYYFPILFDWAAEPEGPHDAFIQSLDHFVSYFWMGLGLLVNEENHNWAMALGHFWVRFALYLLFYLNLRHFLKEREALTATLVLALAFSYLAFGPLGRGEVLVFSLTHSGTNALVFLAALLAALKKKWLLSGLLLGLGFNINAFTFAWGALALGLGALQSPKGPARFRAALWLAVGFALAAWPTGWKILETLEATAPQLPAYDSRDFLRAYYGRHFFFDEVPLASRLSTLLLVLGVGLFLVRLARLIEKENWRLLAALAGSLVGIMVFGIALPYLGDFRMLLHSQPMRMDFILVWLFYLLAAVLIFSEGRAREYLPLVIALAAGSTLMAAVYFIVLRLPERRRALLLLILAAAIVASGALPALDQRPDNWVVLALLALSVALLPFIQPVLALLPARLSALGLLAGLDALGRIGWLAEAPYLAAGALFLLTLSQLKAKSLTKLLPLLALAGALAAAYLLRHNLKMAPLVPALTLLPLVVLLAWRKRLLPAPRLVIAAAVPAFLLLAQAMGFFHLASKGSLDRYPPASRALLDAQLWARANTAAGSVFLAPDRQLILNDVPSFWTLSRRSVYVDWRLGAGAHWQPDFYWYWAGRMDEVTALSSVEEKLAFARAKDIDYVILSKDEALPASTPPALYDDGFWQIIPAR